MGRSLAIHWPTLSVVIRDIGRERVQTGNRDHRECRGHSDAHLAIALQKCSEQVAQSGGELVAADYIVEDYLQGPRRRQSHHRLDQHCSQYDEKTPELRAD